VPGTHRQLDLAHFPEESAVQKVYLCAYLPRDLTFLGALGPWTDEMVWQWQSPQQARAQRMDEGRSGWVLVPRQTDQQLLAWVRENLNVELSHFPGDGRPYVFSALRPIAPPKGSLRLTAVSTNWLNAGVVVAVVLIGLVFLPQTVARKAAAVVVPTVLLVIAGVFLPTFSRQIMGIALYATAGVVLLVWIVWHGVQLAGDLKTRYVQARAARAAAAAARPPAATPPPSPPTGANPPADGDSPFSAPAAQQEGGHDHA
jgi:hypothetical protein